MKSNVDVKHMSSNSQRVENKNKTGTRTFITHIIIYSNKNEIGAVIEV